MSRWKQLEEIEERLPDVSAEELRAAIAMWGEHLQGLRGPALKLGKKFLQRLERAMKRTLEKEIP
jgi:hypothetical protein